MKRITLLLCAGAALLGAAEPQAWNWPTFVRIGVEEVRPGKEALHQQNEFAWSKVLAEAKSPHHFLGMTPVAGPTNQAWWVWPLASLAELEKLNAFVDERPALKAKVDPIVARDGEYITNYGLALYALRADLSRGPVSMAPRFYWLYLDTLRPGREADYEAYVKLVLEGYGKAGLEAKWAVYQALAGTPDPVSLVVIPLRTLSDMETLMAGQGKFAAALGPEGLKTLSRLQAESVAREASFLLGVDPKLSYPDPAEVAADPEFWKAWAAKPPAPKK